MTPDADSSPVDASTDPEPAGRKRGRGFLVGLLVLGLGGVVSGVYLIARWEELGSVSRPISILLFVLGVLLLLPPLLFWGAQLALIYFTRKLLKNYSKGAAEMIAGTREFNESLHEYRPGSPADLGGLDRNFYDSYRDKLVGLGFESVGDIVNETVESIGQPTIPLRILISPSGETVVALYHLKLPGTEAGPDSPELKFFDIGTELTDGSFLMTSNTAAHDLLNPPPKLKKNRHPLDTSLEVLLQDHEAKKGELLASDASLAVVRVKTLEDVLAGERRQQQIKIDFRTSVGFLEGDEVRRMARASGLADELVEGFAGEVDKQRSSGNGAK